MSKYSSASYVSDSQLISSVLRISLDKASRLYADNDYSLKAVLEQTNTGQLVLEAAERYLGEHIKRGDALKDVNAVRSYLCHRLRGYPYEVFACLFLDNKHRVIEYEEMFRGAIDSASVHPREVIRRAIHHNAAAVVFAHNHPSGVAEPSQADHRITDRLKDALGMVFAAWLIGLLFLEFVMEFIKIIGGSSTTASLDGRKLGHNVNAVLYSDGSDFVVSLESNASKVRGVDDVRFDSEEAYNEWEDSRNDGYSLMLHGLDLFGCSTAWSGGSHE